MRRARYQVTLNGFHVKRETYDDLLQWDGQRDEVYAQWANTKVDAFGQVVYTATMRTPVMGDINNMPGRISAGTSSAKGGLRTGDSFPHDEPWLKRRTYVVEHPAFTGLPTAVVVCEPRPERPVPPIVMWEGTLADGETLVVVPSLWEWDGTKSLIERFVNWHKALDVELGGRAKAMFGTLPAVGVVFDAVRLGIDTAQFLTTVTGSSGPRPIGMSQAPGGKYTYEPKMLVLSVARIEAYLADNPTGKGSGLGFIALDDATEDLHGQYELWWQVERLGPLTDEPVVAPGVVTQSGWRWCSACHGLFYGPLHAVSACPAGGAHADPDVSRSGNYSLRMGGAGGVGSQAGWRWCNRCQGLYFGPMQSTSRCPRGGPHADAATSGSADYVLRCDTPLAAGYQDEWRWCPQCSGLYYGPQRDLSDCPAGGRHGSTPATESSNYLLAHL